MGPMWTLLRSTLVANALGSRAPAVVWWRHGGRGVHRAGRALVAAVTAHQARRGTPSLPPGAGPDAGRRRAGRSGIGAVSVRSGAWSQGGQLRGAGRRLRRVAGRALGCAR